jgi:nicotinamide-nucleotide amidase
VARVVEAIAVGTELLLGQIANTNGQLLARVLAEHGALHYYQVVVGDNRARLVAALRQALARADMVVTIGGLGPTLDDLTKEAVAEVFGRRLVLDEPSWQRIVERFRARGQEPTPNNRRQAEIPEGAVAIPNHHGTAPGVLLEAPYRPPEAPPDRPPEPKVVVCLPGPPAEFRPMVTGFLADYLERWAQGGGERTVLLSRTLRVAGMGESQVEHQIRDLVEASNPTVATYAKPGEVEVRLTARAGSPEEAREMLRPLEAEVRRRLGPWMYGTDDDTLGGAVVRELAARGLTLAVAESCTGGLLSERLTEAPGASAAFLLGAVAYANEAKAAVLGVPAELLAGHGAVSEPVARAMAEGVRARAGAALGIGITGIAGPDGGSPDKPVGTVFLALAAPEGTWCRRLALSGDRAAIRWRASQEALVTLRRYVLAGPGALESG